ncbi:MAG: thioredoxin domain-containing protein [Longimicrobiales bacterium]
MKSVRTEAAARAAHTLPGLLPARAGGGSTRFLSLVLLAAAFTVLSACGSGSAASSEQDRKMVAGGEIPEVLATIGDEEVTMADIRNRMGDELDRMEMQYLRARSRAIESTLEMVLRERVILKEARGLDMSVDELVAAEAGGSLDPSELEVEIWYQENQARLGGRTLEDVRSQIADHLRDERRREVAFELEDRLFREREVAIHFEPVRLNLDNESSPFLGPEDAPVTLVEFSDFECPYCARLAPTLNRLREAFGDDLRIVYRQFPLTSIHPGAFKAAEGSLCAHEQGRFWEMHDLMFAEMQQLAVADLKEKARRLGLDGARFDECLDSGRYVEQVQADLREASRIGVTGTPALFINGVQLEGGAVAFETAASAIRKELARVQR